MKDATAAGAAARGPVVLPVEPSRLDRPQSIVRAYELIGQAPDRIGESEITARLEIARRNRWWEVVCLLHLAGSKLDVADPAAAGHLEAMNEAAERSGDDSLIACALAVRVEQGRGDQADLARAAVMLDDLSGSVVHRPMAYVALSLGYFRGSLWELSHDMLDRATAALDETWPPGLARVQELVIEIIALNRYSQAVPRVCSLLELGERDQARHAARESLEIADRMLEVLARRARIRISPGVEAAISLLGASAARPRRIDARDLLHSLPPLGQQGFRAMALLAEAVERLDAGDAGDAAALAESALLHEDPHFGSWLTRFALYMSAQADTFSPGWRRLAAHQAREHQDRREYLLRAARTQLTAERSLLETDRSHLRAYVDELTGLGNRYAYRRFVARLRQGPPEEAVAVLMLDVDHFKEVNDRYGHAVGDEVLRRLGATVLAATRSDDLAVRVGGDEFLVLLTGRPEAEVRQWAGRLVSRVQDTDWSSATEGLSVGVSLGLSFGPAADLESLLHSADHNMYAAKTAGRGRLVHDEDSLPA